MEPDTLANLGTHRMIYSMVFVIFGLFWHVYILGKYSCSSEDPTENLYKDKVLVCTCCAYVGYVLFCLFEFV